MFVFDDLLNISALRWIDGGLDLDYVCSFCCEFILVWRVNTDGVSVILLCLLYPFKVLPVLFTAHPSRASLPFLPPQVAHHFRLLGT